MRKKKEKQFFLKNAFRASVATFQHTLDIVQNLIECFFSDFFRKKKS